MEERLHKFVRLVDAGSFTKAAKKMHVSQPALTVAIAKLEKELGAQLIMRESRPLELTDAGKVAYDAGVAQAIALDNLRTKLTDLAGRRPRIHIGMIDSVAAMLSAYAKPLTELEKAADLSVIVNDSHFLREAIDERTLDLAVVISNGRSKNEPPIAEELMVLVVSPMELAAKQAELAKGSLTDFICYNQPSTTYQIISDGMAAKGVKIHTRLQSSSPEVIAHMVVSGNGVAMLPYFMVRGQLITNSLAVMQKDGAPVTLVRQLVAITTSGKQQAKSVKLFTEQVAEVLGTAYNEAVTAVSRMGRKK